MFDIFFQIPALLFVVGFILVGIFVLPVRKLAPKIGLTDKPGGRKAHDGEIPLIGGVVLFPVFIVLSVLLLDPALAQWPLYCALLILLIVGAVDDRVHLPAFVKFGMQFVAAALVVFPGGAVLQSLGNLFGLGPFDLGMVSIPFSIVAVVLLINAINLMDGLDGLAGGTSFVILGWFLVACLMAGEFAYKPSIMVLMGCVAGFLIYNMRNPWRRKASVFLGDAGSMCLGLMVGWYAIQLGDGSPRVVEPMAVAWVLALPIWDECAQFYRRVREGRHPFDADRGHFHHHFIEAGFTPGQASVCIMMIMLVLGGFGVMGEKLGVPLPVLTVAWIVGILAHMWFSRDVMNYPRVFNKLKT